MATLSDDELLRWTPRMGMLTVAEKIEQGELLKRQANVHFKRGDIKKALPVYAKVRLLRNGDMQQVFAYVNGLSVQGDAMAQYAGSSANMSATAAEGDAIRELKIAVWANMAFCHVKLGARPEKAIEYCDKVLEEDEAHSKALFRKAQALVQLKHFERAHAILTKLATAEPKNAAVRAELRSLVQLKKQYDDEARAKEKSVYGKMFNKK